MRLTLVLLFATTLAAAQPQPPGKLIDVGGGRRMHLVCEGSGNPTVVFESGSGEGWYSWALVQPVIARTMRACSYDRAGVGFSDPRAGERTVSALNADLHELLRRSGEKGPYILAGHSIGGILVRRYAMRYPEDVAGIVLVDSAVGNFDARFPPSAAEVERVKLARAARRKQLDGYRAEGKWQPMDFHDAVPRELLTLVKPRSGSESWWEARFAESAMPDINEPASDPKHPFTFPLAVITATGWPRFAWHTEERHAAWAQARMDAQKELAASSTKSHHVLIGSNHYVQLEHPQTVIEAIQFVVSAAATP